MKTKKGDAEKPKEISKEKVLSSREIGRVKSNVLMLNHELNKRLKEIRRLNNEIKEAHKVTINRDNELTILRKKYGKAEHNLEVLKQELDEKNKEVKSLEHELDIRSRELQLEKKHNKEEVTKLRGIISYKERELDETKQIVIHHHERLGVSRKKMEDKDFELIRLGQRSNSLTEENNRLRDLIGGKDNQIHILKETVVKKNKIIGHLNKEIDIIKEELEK